MVQVSKNIEALIEDGGDITLGALPPHQCAATAADGSNCLAMLVRRDGESLNALLKRLDKAIGLAWSNDTFIDEVNDGESDLL
jgi:ribosome assembly protein YihI (activator of Der GTPase)